MDCNRAFGLLRATDSRFLVGFRGSTPYGGEHRDLFAFFEVCGLQSDLLSCGVAAAAPYPRSTGASRCYAAERTARALGISNLHRSAPPPLRIRSRTLLCRHGSPSETPTRAKPPCTGLPVKVRETKFFRCRLRSVRYRVAYLHDPAEYPDLFRAGHSHPAWAVRARGGMQS